MKLCKVFLSELKAMCHEASKKEYSNMEIGGDIYGTWTDQGNPIIWLITGTGSDSHSYSTKFSLDVQHINNAQEYLYNNYGLKYMGDWHSHHNLGLFKPSSGDQRRIRNIMSSTKRDKMIEIIVNHLEDKESVSLYYYGENRLLDKCNIEILDVNNSPLRDLLSFTSNRWLNLLRPKYDPQKILLNNIEEENRNNKFDYFNLFFKDLKRSEMKNVE